MMLNVMYDLRIFMIFYTILIFMFSLMFSVIGIGLLQIQSTSWDDRAKKCSLDEPTSRRMLKAKGGGGSGS